MTNNLHMTLCFSTSVTSLLTPLGRKARGGPVCNAATLKETPGKQLQEQMSRMHDSTKRIIPHREIRAGKTLRRAIRLENARLGTKKIRSTKEL